MNVAIPALAALVAKPATVATPAVSANVAIPALAALVAKPATVARPARLANDAAQILLQ